MLSVEFTWHPHTEEPPFKRASVIVSVPDNKNDDGVAVIVGLYEWDGERLQPTDFSMDVPDAPFFWALEIDVTNGIQQHWEESQKEVA